MGRPRSRSSGFRNRLSGTASIDLLEPMMDLDAPMDRSTFAAAFQRSRTDFDWLSRDEEQVDRYVADDHAGLGLDIAGGKAMFVGARALADRYRQAGLNDLTLNVCPGCPARGLQRNQSRRGPRRHDRVDH